jgi:predicted O-methyltransferase YrrM
MSPKRILKHVARGLGYHVARLERTSLPISERFCPGHFYSVIPCLSDVTQRAETIFSKTAPVPCVDLNTEEQIQVLTDFAAMEEKPPFYAQQRTKRFNIDNGGFSYDDAPVLHYMIRRLRPKRIIEIGSGDSSACMLDTSDNYLGGSVDFTFIDVDCGNLRKNLLEDDLRKVRILEQPVQDVDRSLFTTLQANDLLFVDSSHVMKPGSDVSTILFELLPALSPGVCIHFHDVRYPFQYTQDMVMGGVFWNEAYLLRAFLMNNAAYAITFWLNSLVNQNTPAVKDLLRFLPLSEWDRRFNGSRNDFSAAGGSIYLTKRS